MNINFPNSIQNFKIFNKNNFASAPVFKANMPRDIFERQKSNVNETIAFSDFLMKYNYSQDQAIRAIQRGKIRTVEFDSEQAKRRTSFLRSHIDLSDPATVEEIQKHLKLKPVQSERILNATSGYYPPVSVHYLSKLGYGEPKMLATMVQRGFLEGTIRKTNTPDGAKVLCMVDLSSKTNKVKLQKLRDNNKNMVEISSLAKTLKMTIKEIEQKTLDDEIEIVPRFIYPEDYKKVFYDLSNPKNQEFTQKRLFELELIQKGKMAKSDLSLKMKLIWYFAPKTRAIARKLAMGDGLAKLAITKAKEGADLTEEEIEKLNAYYNSMWQQAGTAEYKKAREWGTMVYEDYKRGGIEAIDDPKLREFILNIVNSKE